MRALSLQDDLVHWFWLHLRPQLSGLLGEARLELVWTVHLACLLLPSVQLLRWGGGRTPEKGRSPQACGGWRRVPQHPPDLTGVPPETSPPGDFKVPPPNPPQIFPFPCSRPRAPSILRVTTGTCACMPHPLPLPPLPVSLPIPHTHARTHAIMVLAIAYFRDCRTSSPAGSCLLAGTHPR